jgi:hypothetical protein
MHLSIFLLLHVFVGKGTCFKSLCLAKIAGLHIQTHRLKLKLICNLRSVGQPILMSGSHLEPMTRFLFSVWRFRVPWCGAPSLTRGWVCYLLVQLLLGLARAVTLESKSRRTHDHILLSHLRLPQLRGPGPRTYILQEQGGPVLPLGTGFPFVASYHSQGYGKGIVNLLHTGECTVWWEGFIKDAVEIDPVTTIHILSCIKISSSIQKLIKGTHSIVI